MYPIEMEEPVDLAVAPSAWQALETAWLGMTSLVALAHTQRRAAGSECGRALADPMPLRRITGSASMRGGSCADA
jgi:hypothetical protein